MPRFDPADHKQNAVDDFHMLPGIVEGVNAGMIPLVFVQLGNSRLIGAVDVHIARQSPLGAVALEKINIVLDGILLMYFISLIVIGIPLFVFIAYQAEYDNNGKAGKSTYNKAAPEFGYVHIFTSLPRRTEGVYLHVAIFLKLCI